MRQHRNRPLAVATRRCPRLLCGSHLPIIQCTYSTTVIIQCTYSEAVIIQCTAMRKSPVPSMQLTEVRAQEGVPLPGSQVSLSFCPHEQVW
jgi:hypothetical protein